MLYTRRNWLKLSSKASLLPFCSPALNLDLFNDSIMKRSIPSTDESLPVIGLGTWQTFDVDASPRELRPLKEVLQAMQTQGGTMIDSSPMYGRSEKVVGKLTQDLEIDQHFFYATKVWTTGKEEGIQQMKASFEKMQRQQMDLMQIHNLVDWKTHLKTLKDWKAEGKIRYIGITHYTNSSHELLEEIIKTEDIDFVQFNFSIHDRNAEDRLLPTAIDQGVATIINRPYQGGHLFRAVKGHQLPEWAKEFQINSWGQFFLKYILSNPAVNCVIPGTSKVKHMLDNLQAGFGELPDQMTRQKMVDFIHDL